MKPRISLITLGVDDLPKSLAFYRAGLGWPTEGIVGQQFEHGAVAFFDLQSGLRLALWPRASIACTRYGSTMAAQRYGIHLGAQRGELAGGG